MLAKDLGTLRAGFTQTIASTTPQACHPFLEDPDALSRIAPNRPGRLKPVAPAAIFITFGERNAIMTTGWCAAVISSVAMSRLLGALHFPITVASPTAALQAEL